MAALIWESPFFMSVLADIALSMILLSKSFCIFANKQRKLYPKTHSKTNNMYKIAIASIACCISLAIHAQNADMRISELVSTSNWFTLEEEYPQLKDTVQFDFVRLMAEAMIAQNFNREKEATDMFQTLINSHQQQIGSGAALYLAEMILRNYEHCGMYGLAAEKADNLIEQIKTSGAPIDYTNLLDIHKKNKALSKYDSTIVIRHRTKDIILPFTMENTDALFSEQAPVSNRYYIPISVHGTTYQFMLDTGATTTYLSKRFADLIGVEYIDYSSPYGQLAYLDSMKLGDVTFKNVIALVHNGTPLDSICHIDAVLGMDLVRRLDEMRIDNKKNQITFPAQTSKKPEFGRNLRCSNQFLFVEAEDAKGPLSVLLDSGAETGFTYNYFLKHQNELSKFRGTKEITTGGVDGFHSTMAIYVPTVNFIICNQELKLKDVYVPYMKTKNNYDDIVLGIDFLRKYDNVTLNFKDMFMVIE